MKMGWEVIAPRLSLNMKNNVMTRTNVEITLILVEGLAGISSIKANAITYFVVAGQNEKDRVRGFAARGQKL
jgi:hypothetical protein